MSVWHAFHAPEKSTDRSCNLCFSASSTAWYGLSGMQSMYQLLWLAHSSQVQGKATLDISTIAAAHEMQALHAFLNSMPPATADRGTN